MNDLRDLITQSPKDIQQISIIFNELIEHAVKKVNAEFSIRRLVKGTRANEPLPTIAKQLSSYRTRIGTMLEYALSTELEKILIDRFGKDFYFTFAVSHEYPDFYFRDITLTKVLRVEMKAVDAESDEQAARFSVPTYQIEKENDLLLLVGWEWKELIESNIAIGEYPHIFTSLVIPAEDIVNERDKRLTISGGKISENQVLVPKRGHIDQFVIDPGNYGKLWRLIHRSRRKATDLSPSILRFLDFLRIIDEHSPNSRFK